MKMMSKKQAKRALLFALLLGSLVSEAKADVVSIGNAIYAVVTSFWFQAAVMVATVATSVEARKSARHKQNDMRLAYNASLQDRSVTTIRSIPPWRIVYGRCITGGDVRAIFTTDKAGFRRNNDPYTRPDALKHIVVTFADHEVHALHEVYVDGIAVNIASLNSNGGATVGEFAVGDTQDRSIQLAPGASFTSPEAITVMQTMAQDGLGDLNLPLWIVGGTYSLSNGNKTITSTHGVPILVSYTVQANIAAVSVHWHLGTDTQTVDTFLNGLVPTKWTSAHRLRGKAYAVITLDLEFSRFQGGPPNITFDTSGKKLFDPRTGLTIFSANNALCARDFLLGEYGYECTTADIDDAYVIEAANACDVTISLNVGGVITSGTKYRCDGVYTTDQDKEQMFEEICRSMCGQAFYGARWMITAGAWKAPVMDLTEKDLHGAISLPQADEGLETIYNSVRGTYIDSTKATPSDFDAYQNLSFLADDGGQAIWEDMSLPFTNNKARCRNIARIRMEQNRSGQVIRYPAKLRAWKLQVGDRVRVTSAEYGLTLKYYRVTDWGFDSTSAVQLQLREDDPSIYDEADAASGDPTPNTGLKSPWVVAMVENANATSANVEQADGTFQVRVRVFWDAITDGYVVNGNGKVEVEWRRMIDPPNVSQIVRVSGNDVQAYIDGVANGAILLISVKAINSLGQIGRKNYFIHVVTGSVSSAASARNNLLDPSWWSPGARMRWNENSVPAGENSFAWSVGPKGFAQALWKAIAAGSPGIEQDGGWNPGTVATTPTNAFRVDKTKTYRFAVPVYRASGSAAVYWGVLANSVCNLNTTTLQVNPYFAGNTGLVLGRWYLMVGYVFPAGATGLTHDGAGIYDMLTGALFAAGTNFNWADTTQEASTRAYQFYASSGATQYFAPPMAHLVDGTEPSMNELLGGAALLNSQQQWADVNGRPFMYRVSARGYTDTSALIGVGVYNGETGAQINPTGGGRSYTLLRIVRATGGVSFCQAYDVYASTSEAAAMAAALNASGPDVIVIVFTNDEPYTNRLSAGLAEAMYRCGASPAVFGSPRFAGRSAYVLIGVPGCGEGAGFEAYNGSSPTTSAVDVAFTLKNGSYIVTGSSSTPGALADYSYTGSLDATGDIVLVPSGTGLTVQGNSIRRPASAGGGWNAQVTSSGAFSSGAFAAFRGIVFEGADTALMAGLTTDPAANASYDSIDYAIYFATAGILQIYENGVFIGQFGTWASGDTGSVEYDNDTIAYAINGTIIRQIKVPRDMKLYFDSSIFRGGLDNVRFGTMSAVSDIDTDQLAPNAINETVLDPFDFAGTIVPGGSGFNTMRTINYTPQFQCDIDFDAVITADNVLPDSGNSLVWRVSVNGGADVDITGCSSDSGARQTFSGVGSISAAAGLPLAIKTMARRLTGNPIMHLYTSSVRLGVKKR